MAVRGSGKSRTDRDYRNNDNRSVLDRSRPFQLDPNLSKPFSLVNQTEPNHFLRPAYLHQTNAEPAETLLHGIRRLGYEILILAAPPLPLHPRAPGEIEIDLRRGQRPPRMRRGSL